MTENKFTDLSEKLIPVINNTKKNWPNPSDKCVEIRGIEENIKLKCFVGKNHNTIKFLVQKYYDVSFRSNDGSDWRERDVILNENNVETLFYDGSEFLNSCELNFDDNTDLINYDNGKIILDTYNLGNNVGYLNTINISKGSAAYTITEKDLGFTPPDGFQVNFHSKFESFEYDVKDNCVKVFHEWSKIKGFSKNKIEKVNIHFSGYGNGSEYNTVIFELTKDEFIEEYGEDEFDELDLNENGYYKENELESYDAVNLALNFEPDGEFVAVVRDVFYTENEIGFDVSEREITSTKESLNGYYLMYGGAYDCEGKQLSEKDLEKFNNSSQERSSKYDGVDLYRLDDFDLDKELKTNF